MVGTIPKLCDFGLAFAVDFDMRASTNALVQGNPMQ